MTKSVKIQKGNEYYNDIGKIQMEILELQIELEGWVNTIQKYIEKVKNKEESVESLLMVFEKTLLLNKNVQKIEEMLSFLLEKYSEDDSITLYVSLNEKAKSLMTKIQSRYDELKS